MAVTKAQVWWWRVAVVAVRVLVGGTFAFSGFVKAIDPYGGYYKITEYLMALGLESLTGLALVGAIALAATEFMLGVMLIVGAHRRVAPWLTMAMLAVMTPLTLWLAVTDAVPDCGCFGDALVLTNWQTFAKNVLLLIATTFLIIYNRRAGSLYRPVLHWLVPLLAVALAVAIALRGYFVQPLLDFRPYPVGTKLVATGADEGDEGDYRFIYENADGVRQDFALDSLPDEEAGWTYVDRYKLPGNDTVAPSDDGTRLFTIRDVETGADVSSELLNDTIHDVVMLLFPSLPTVSIGHTYTLNRLTDLARSQGANVVGLTPATELEVERWNDISLADYTMYRAEDTEVKMLARGNPAVVMLHDGTVMWKRTLSSIDDERLVGKNTALLALGGDLDGEAELLWLFYGWLAAMIALILLNPVAALFRVKRDNVAERPGQGQALQDGEHL